ncbi:MAG: FtsX-like permease family protein [Acidobacteriota bacterium]|nr:FtsX-like permease family protein [Acidobacteriota bacterium]MDH3522587.1 FtsX-like permease family protein [Acidobacteriota bacterium]
MRHPSPPYGRALRAEWRAAPGRLLFFVGCLAVGVAAVVAVATHAAALDRGIRGEARQLLAADLAVSGARPVGEDTKRLLIERGAATASVRELVTIVAAPSGGSLLVELKAVDPGYPFYGELETTPALAIGDLGPDGALVARDVLARLSLAVGGTLLVGGEPFRVAGVVDREPDRVTDVFTLGPRVFVTSEGLARTTLEQFGSRVGYRLLAALPAALGDPQRAALLEEVRATLDPTAHRVETYAEAQPALRRAIDRVSRFVGLVALLSLLLGGVGIAYTLQAWLARRIDDIALLRCLGWRPREVLSLYVLQALLLGILGSLVGCLAGTAAAAVLPRLAGELLPVRDLALWQPAALARGALLGVGVALLFTLPPVLAVRRVAPLRALRRDVEPVPMPWWLRAGVGAVLLAGTWLAATLQAASAVRGLLFTAGLAGATLVLALLTRGAMRLVGPLAGLARGTAVRQGLLALARPGAATVSASIALGLGILLVLAMRLVELGLTATLRSQLPAAAPSAFLVDIQPDQWPAVEDLLTGLGGRNLESVPVVSARLRAVAGVPVEDLVADAEGNRRWGLTREQRLTYLRELPADNRIVAGELWSDPTQAEASLEQDFASDAGIALGDRLEFDVQGVPVAATVTSLRTVEWRTFGINFFIVVEPGVLDGAPQMRVATVQLPDGGEQAVQDALAASFPNVTLLRIRQILDRIAAILERLAVGVRFLGGFTVLAGLVILASAVSAAAGQRGRETALLKTLGMTRRQIVAQSAIEHLLIGLIAAAVGAAGGNLLAWAVLTRGMELEWAFDPATTVGAVALCVALTTATALCAAWPALRTRPLAVLSER